MILEVSIHHGREGMGKQSSSHYGGWEAEKEHRRRYQGTIQPKACP
jgi:hypothetical protein